MARALLIHNPSAARTGPKVVDTVRRIFAAEGWDLEVVGTSRQGHATELAEAGVADGVERIVVYGGDGTTMQAVRGLVGRDVSLGLIPGGTGNVLAGNLRLPRQPAAAARIAARGVPKAIDLGVLAREDGEHHFAVSCGTGFDAELMMATEEAKRRWRMGAYVARGWDVLKGIQIVNHRITVDDETFEADAVMVLIANCGEIIPPFLKLRDGILPDDGLFDVVVVNASTVVEGMDVLWRMLTGRVDTDERLWFARGRHVSVETDRPRPVQLDGDPCGSTPLSVRILPAAMNVVLPRKS